MSSEEFVPADAPAFEFKGGLDKLAAALAKAQSKIEAASKDRVNPHFRSAYATLASVWDACRAALTENGLAVSQLVSAQENKVTVDTILMHSSGQWIRSRLTTQAKGAGPQDIGSAITYCRRYGLAAMVGVAPDEDDDGNAAQGRDREAGGSERQHNYQRREFPDQNRVGGPAGPPEPPEDKSAAVAKAIEGWKAAFAKAATETQKKVKELGKSLSAVTSQEVRDACRPFYEAALEKTSKKPGAVTNELLGLGGEQPSGEAREPGSDG